MESCIWPECYSSKLNFIASTGDRKNLFTETSTGNFRDLHLSVCIRTERAPMEGQFSATGANILFCCFLNQNIF